MTFTLQTCSFLMFFSRLTSRFSRFVSLFLIVTFISCQPKAKYITLSDPMQNFAPDHSDSVHGAKTIEDLGCYFYIALKGNISLEQLLKFFPDSSEISSMYVLTRAEIPGGNEIKSNADTVRHRLSKEFLEAKSRAAVMHSSWTETSLNKLLVLEMEHQNLPSKKIILEASDGKITLRASAMCVQIGNRWFLGEDIRFGV